MGPKVLFFDADGVLNDGTAQANGYCGVTAECVRHFNTILRAVPDLRLVVISSWRYLVHNGSCTLDGLTNLFLVCGLDCFDRIDGVTESDEATCGGRRDYAYLKEHGARIRREQVYSFARAFGVTHFVVVDDLDLGMTEQVMTDGARGLSASDAAEIIRRLGA